MKVDAAPVQLGEVPLHGTERGLELHAHWHHPVACNHLGVPDSALLIGILVAVRVDHDILAGDSADDRRACEILIPVCRQRFSPYITEAEIVVAAPVEDGHNLRTLPAMSKLALHYEIGRQLIDCAMDLFKRDEQR